MRIGIGQTIEITNKIAMVVNEIELKTACLDEKEEIQKADKCQQSRRQGGVDDVAILM